MGSGSTINVSDEDILKWTDNRTSNLKTKVESLFTPIKSTLVNVNNSLTIAEGVFTHISHEDDYDITQNITAEISLIENALFKDGQHPSIQNKVQSDIKKSGVILVLSEACSIFGDLHTLWSDDVISWLSSERQPNYKYESNHDISKSVGVGFSLGVIQISQLTEGPDTSSTKKGYIATAFNFILTYSHEEFLKYEQAQDAALIEKIKQEIKDKQDQANIAISDINRSISIDPNRSSSSKLLHQSTVNFWSESLKIISDAENRDYESNN
jgi:hypothetical protein